MEIYIRFSLFRFVFGIEVKLFKKDVTSGFNKYYSSVEFVMEKHRRLNVASNNS